MIIRKLAVPFINEKILSQAVQCSIATSALSGPGFDFFMGRLSLKCKVEVLTGLRLPTSPDLLKRILKHFPDRVRLKLFTANTFDANLYIIDLPFRKAVAFVGSGNFTLGGFKDSEELFYKVTDPKEIESLRSWFTGHFEFAEALTEAIIDEYGLVYPSILRRYNTSKQEMDDALNMTTRGFSWENIAFKKQYFQKEDFLVFGNRKSGLNTPEVRSEREAVQNKLSQLHHALKDHLSVLRLYEDSDPKNIVNAFDPAASPEQKTNAMWLAYGRSQEELKAYDAKATHPDFMLLLVVIRQLEVAVWLMPGKEGTGMEDREFFKSKMHEPGYRKDFFQSLAALNSGATRDATARGNYWITIAGEKKWISAFQNEDALLEFTRYDDWKNFSFIIGRNYAPGDPQISKENIVSTISKEFDKLVVLYRQIRQP